MADRDELIYGRRPVLEALQSGSGVRRVLLAAGSKRGGIIADIQAAAEAAGVPVVEVARQTLDRRVSATHQGVAAEVAPFRYATVDEIVEAARRTDEPLLLLLLDGLQDVHNFGALLRTAEAVGVHGVLIPKDRSVSVTSTVYKTSAGAVSYVPIAQVTNLVRTMNDLKQRGLWFVGLDMAGAQRYDQARLTGPLGVVIGAEGHGLGRLVAESCDFLVHLPMHGRIESLNASVAGSVLLYEVLRQRQNPGPS
ncbi:MAG: 23S rRNA (guanosine(2251)-2'-O)-methyltransferase RlmB [Ardenticatenaceae bacterium]|nr:23S rRNA (guanosine(2251)-2'-O)-methyltransferase RlmB [Ardenticatenaceae bacterium]HBY98760.1 23S rRNA (guanosine(2251)-2'-O)-methyltransferase RlmB [Chloroflexota bacterium]